LSTTDGKRAPRRRASLLLAALCLLAAPAAASAQEAGRTDGDGVRRLTINVEPFKDFLAEGKRLLDAGKLGPAVTFDSTITAELDASGEFKLETVESRNTASDAEGMKLAARLAQAISDSRLFSILDGAKQVQVSVKLDEHALSASASSELESEEKASQYVKGYGLLLYTALKQKKGTRLEELYGGMGFASEGRRFVMKLELPREVAVRLFREAADRAAGAGRN